MQKRSVYFVDTGRDVDEEMEIADGEYHAACARGLWWSGVDIETGQGRDEGRGAK